MATNHQAEDFLWFIMVFPLFSLPEIIPSQPDRPKGWKHKASADQIGPGQPPEIRPKGALKV